MIDEDAPGLADRYELRGEIGRGGSARVLRAWDRRLQRDVAIKILPFDVDVLAARRRRHEVELLASLDHPTLVTLLDTVVDEHATYLVMELMEGGTLRDRMREGALTLADVRAIATDAGRALEHIHARGVVHRDVKPANLLLPEAGSAGPVVKLSDFGIAKLLDLQATRSTGVIGTANYLSPEQAEGRVAGPATDVYSLGLTLIEACTGRTVFPGSIAESVGARLVRDPEVPSWLGAEWRALLTAMVQRDPAARPSGAEVARRAALLPALFDDVATAEMTFTAPIAAIPPVAVLAVTAPVPVQVPAPARTVGVRAVAAAAAVLLIAGTGAALAITGAQHDAAVAAAPAASTPASPRPAPSASASTSSSASAVAAAAATAFRAADVQRTPSTSPSTSASRSTSAAPVAQQAAPRPVAKAHGRSGHGPGTHGRGKAAEKAKARGGGDHGAAKARPAAGGPGKGHGRK